MKNLKKNIGKDWAQFCQEEDTENLSSPVGKKSAVAPPDDPSLLQTVKDMPVIEEVRRFLSINKVKKAFTFGTQLFDAATPFLDKPTWWSAGKAAFHMGKVLVEDVEVYNEDYFSSDDWIEPYGSDFNQTLLHVLWKFPYEKIKTSEENTFIRLTELPNGIKVGWTYSGKVQTVDNIYIESARVTEGKEFIKGLLWEQFKGKNLVMRKNNRFVLRSNESRVVFEEDIFSSKTSKRARDHAEYLKKPLAVGVPRSIMFYGPPGTGKSTVARTIVDLLGLRTFRIRIADLGQLDNSTLFEAIGIFQPEAVILDDFDRTHNQEQLLETLEYFKGLVKLVIVTVNNRMKLDGALRRPGRLDEVVLIDTMDEEVVRAVLGDYADGFDIVKDWPIAFIQEYVVRRTFMSNEEAADSVKELTMRVRELDSYRDDNDDGMKRMMKLLKAAKRGSKPKAPPNEEEGQGSGDGDGDDDCEIEPDMLREVMDEMGVGEDVPTPFSRGQRCDLKIIDSPSSKRFELETTKKKLAKRKR